ISKAYDGQGTIVYADGTVVWLTDVGWKQDVGVMRGKASGQKGKKTDELFVLQTRFGVGDPNCLTKRDNLPPPMGTGPKQLGQGGTAFAHAGWYGVFPFGGQQNPNDLPFLCKDDVNPVCLYNSKK
ncbi:MAG TPA: hypothetical protein VNU01_02465, partial [Egibacteraceae bacterium]|nr:hypothetical protein [Egibacteraceae bacterium]